MVPIATRPRRKDASPAPSTQSTKSETLAADLDDNVSAISGTSKEAAKKGKKKVRILLESDEATAEVLDDKPMEVVEKKKAGRQPRQKLNAILESEESSVTSQEEPSSIPENVQPAAKKVAKAKKEASDPIIEIKSSEEDEKPGRSRRGKRVVYTEESLKVKKRNDPGLTSPESQISESDPDSPAKPAKKVPKTKAVRKAKVDEASTSNVSVTKAPKRGRKGKEPVAPEQVVDLTAVSPEAPIRSARSTRTASVAESSTSSVVAKTAKGRGRAKKQETVEFESDTTSQDKSPEIKKARRGAKALEIVASTPVSSARPIMDESAISRVSVTESSARKGRKKAETTLENSEATPAKRGRGKAAKVEEEAPKESNLKVTFQV